MTGHSLTFCLWEDWGTRRQNKLGIFHALFLLDLNKFLFLCWWETLLTSYGGNNWRSLLELWVLQISLTSLANIVMVVEWDLHVVPIDEIYFFDLFAYLAFQLSHIRTSLLRFHSDMGKVLPLRGLIGRLDHFNLVFKRHFTHLMLFQILTDLLSSFSYRVFCLCNQLVWKYGLTVSRFLEDLSRVIEKRFCDIILVQVLFISQIAKTSWIRALLGSVDIYNRRDHFRGVFVPYHQSTIFLYVCCHAFLPSISWVLLHIRVIVIINERFVK